MYLFITSHTENSKLFVTIFSHALQNIWTTWNTIASILREHILVYLSLNIVCSSKLTFFPIVNLFRSLNFARKCFEKENVDMNEKHLFLTINNKSKGKIKKKNQFPIFNFPFHYAIRHFPFTIPHSPFAIS